MHKTAHITRAGAQIEHEIADPLPRPVISIAPAAPRLDHVKARIEQFSTNRARSRRIDRGVFKQPDQFARAMFGNRGVALGHRFERGAIIHAAGFAPNLDIIGQNRVHAQSLGGGLCAMQAGYIENRFPPVARML